MRVVREKEVKPRVIRSAKFDFGLSRKKPVETPEAS